MKKLLSIVLFSLLVTGCQSTSESHVQAKTINNTLLDESGKKSGNSMGLYFPHIKNGENGIVLKTRYKEGDYIYQPYWFILDSELPQFIKTLDDFVSSEEEIKVNALNIEDLGLLIVLDFRDYISFRAVGKGVFSFTPEDARFLSDELKAHLKPDIE